MEDSLQQTLSGIPEAHCHVYILCNLYPQITGLTVETKISLLNIPNKHPNATPRWKMISRYVLFSSKYVLQRGPDEHRTLPAKGLLQLSSSTKHKVRKIHAKPKPNFIYAEPMPFTVLLRLVGEKERSTENTGHTWHKTLTMEKTCVLQPAVFQDCPSYGFYSSNQHWDQVSLGKKVCFIFCFQVINSPSLREARVGTKAGPWRRIEAEIMSIAAYWLVPCIFFSLPSYTIQDHPHRLALPWGPGNSTSIINQENIWPAYKSVLQKHFIN